MIDPLKFQTRRSLDEAANRALNRWDAAKARVWRRSWPCDYEDLCVAFSGIARGGFGAVKSLERLSFLLDGSEVEELVHYADTARKLCSRAWPHLRSAQIVRTLS